MRKIIVIGAGFAGLSAAARFSGMARDAEVSIFDKKGTADFLPLLPDIIGRQLSPELISFSVKDILSRRKIKFVREEVASVDLDPSRVFTASCAYNYDFLLIASGSQTNFFSDAKAQSQAYALNSVSDTKNIMEALRKERFENFIVCGGGYTGIEAAGSLWLFCRRNGISARIFIVERSPGILGALPLWMKDYTARNLNSMGVEVLSNSVIEDIQGARVKVSGGRVFEKAMLIWVPGVRTADYIQKLEVKKNPQGRIIVDEYLRFRQNCFCAGDTALFEAGGVPLEGVPLRMAVQFSIAEGALAADNIIRSIKGKKLKKYIPQDLGFIIPMANNRSCGRVFGLDIRGLLPTLLHFMMCIYRSYGLKNKIGLAAGMIRSCFVAPK
jgi:NADH dehydrogenase